MAPAFGLVESKGLLPHFMDAATKACGLCTHSIWRAYSGPHRQMADRWSNIIANGKSLHSAVIDVNMWFGKATLDACVLSQRQMWVDRGLIVNPSLKRIGAGAFEYDFGALDETDNPFTRSYTNVTYDRLCSKLVVQGSRRPRLR